MEFKSVHATFLLQKLIHLNQVRNPAYWPELLTKGVHSTAPQPDVMDGELGRGSNTSLGGSSVLVLTLGLEQRTGAYERHCRNAVAFAS